MLQAFHNNEKTQQKYIKRVQAHYKADEIVQGKYWENGKGCAVGCTIQNDDVKKSGSGWHTRYEEALGIPRQLAYLEDRIFEGLTNGEAKEFPLRFLQAINLGADLSQVTAKFIIRLLADKKDGVIKFARPDGKKAIQAVVRLYKKKLAGKEVTTEEWITARMAAYAAAAAAAAYAAYAAAAAAADAAAADAAYAAYAAADAAYAAAADAAYAADARQKARSEHYTKMANKLIELLKEAK